MLACLVSSLEEEVFSVSILIFSGAYFTLDSNNGDANIFLTRPRLDLGDIKLHDSKWMQISTKRWSVPTNILNKTWIPSLKMLVLTLSGNLVGVRGIRVYLDGGISSMETKLLCGHRPPRGCSVLHSGIRPHRPIIKLQSPKSLTLGRFLNVSVPTFPQLLNGANNNTYFTYLNTTYLNNNYRYEVNNPRKSLEKCLATY